jgi:hypothetical protein
MTTSMLMLKKAEKKHSVRYDARDEDTAVTAVYVMKHSLPSPYPKQITISLDWNEEG